MIAGAGKFIWLLGKNSRAAFCTSWAILTFACAESFLILNSEAEPLQGVEEYAARSVSNLRVDLPVDCERSHRANHTRARFRATKYSERLHVASALLRWRHVVPADALEDATHLH